MHSEKQSNFKIKLTLGFQPVVLFNKETRKYALGLMNQNQHDVDCLLATQNDSSQVKWQSQFPISDLLRFGVEAAILKIVTN